MESRFRRFVASRRLSSASAISHQNPAVDDLDRHSIAYESTSPAGKLPVFIHQPLRKSTVARRARDHLDSLAIRAFSYDSTLAGKPPVMGGRPLKGNGPIKLQMSRRLSSGELLATTQDPERTLEDIREGQYIVGRKEKRLSLASRARTPTPVVTGAISPGLHSSLKPSLPLPMDRAISQCSTEGSMLANITKGRHSVPSSPAVASIPADLQESRSNYPRHKHLSVSDTPPETGDMRPPPARGSLLSRHEEQNATIQALWKAEYTRLVAIYGKDGVDRNIAELNQDHGRSSSPEKNQSTLDAMSALGMTLDQLPKPSFDSSSDLPWRRGSRISSTKDTSSADEASDYASTKRSSLTSSDALSSLHTVRMSGFEPGLPTTREDVRKVVEDMRSTYLRAIEAKGAENILAKRVKKKRERASYSPGHAPTKSSMSKPLRPTRQSWHASNASQFTSPIIGVGNPGRTGKALEQVESSPSRNNTKSMSSLQRADSTTLGSLLAEPSTPLERLGNRKSPDNFRTMGSPQTPKAAMASPPDLRIHEQVADYNDEEALGPNIAPEIDDFDIFYQDLYGPPPTAASMPSISTKTPRSRQNLADDSEAAAAPPPPDIEWTPRRVLVD